MRTGSKAFRKSKTHSEGKSRKGEEKCKKGREREKGEGEVRVPDRGGHASTQYETENPCLGSVMLEHRHRILCPKGYRYKNIHNIHIQRIHRHSHTLSTHNTITHSHTHAVTAAVAALDDITLPGGAAEGASAAYTRKGIQF